MTKGGGGMRERQKYKNLSISRMKRTLVDEVKSIFHNYLRVIMC